MKGLSIQFGKEIGEMYFLDSMKTAVAFDKDAPDTFFPGICLDAIDIFDDIDVANWADFVPHLRAKALTYNEGITGSKSSFDVTDWDITSNVATLTFANTTAEIAILTALLEDNLVHGSYTNWRSITLGSVIGDISAGEYAITAIDTTLRTVKFAFAASNNSGSGAFTTNFYTNRVPGSTTTARVYEATARTLVSANDDDGQNINGLRMRDAMQRITGNIIDIWASGAEADGAFSQSTGALANEASTGIRATSDIFFDSSTSVSPNTAKSDDKFTRVRSLGAHLYVHGRSFI
jgi:hypothetical protein